MTSTDQKKPTGKSGGRKGKAEQRSKKPTPPHSLKADQQGTLKSEPSISEQEQAASPPVHQQVNGELSQRRDMEADQRSSARADSQSMFEPGQVESPQPAPLLNSDSKEHGSPKPKQAPAAEERAGAVLHSATNGAAAMAERAHVNLQSLANAYSEYTRKSLEQTRSFVDKLSGVRSLDKIIEAQAEFAKQTYENFVAGSQRICELQRELATQAFKPLQRLANRRLDQL